MATMNNGKKKILNEIDEAIGEDKSQEILSLVQKNRKEVTEAYKEILQKQGIEAGKIDDLIAVFALKLDALTELLKMVVAKDLHRVEVVNQVIPPSEVSISNLQEIAPKDEIEVRRPFWIDEFISIISSAISPLYDFIRKQFGRIEAHVDPKNPLAVRLSDGQKFIDKLTQVAGILQQPAPVGLDKEARDLLIGIIDAVENIDIDLNAENINVSLDSLEELSGSNLVNVYKTDAVEVAKTEDELLISYDVPSGYNFMIKGVWVEGNGDGVFTLVEGEGFGIWIGRNSWTRRSFTEAYEYHVPEGATIFLKVQNPDNQSNLYTGGFWGYLITK